MAETTQMQNNGHPITRRAVCLGIAGSVLSGSITGLLGRTALAKVSERSEKEKTDKKFRLRYILASSMYGKLPIGDILGQVAKSGTDRIDIWPRVHADQREQIEKMGHDQFRKLLGQHKVKLGISTRYDLGPYRLKEEFQFVKNFSGKIIVSGSGRGEGKTLREKVKSMVASLQQHVQVAESFGVTIAIENHAGSLINSFDSLRYLAEFAKSSRLGVALAPYHLKQDEAAIARLIQELGPKMVHFYAWEHGLGCHKKLPKEQEMMQLPGLGKLDFTPIMEALKKIDYHGWTEVFMHPVPRGIPILPKIEQVTAAINKSRTYLEKCVRDV